MFTSRVMAVGLATVAGFLGTASTLAADEGGTFSVLRSYVRDHATYEAPTSRALSLPKLTPMCGATINTGSHPDRRAIPQWNRRSTPDGYDFVVWTGLEWSQGYFPVIPNRFPNCQNEKWDKEKRR